MINLRCSQKCENILSSFLLLFLYIYFFLKKKTPVWSDNPKVTQIHFLKGRDLRWNRAHVLLIHLLVTVWAGSQGAEVSVHGEGGEPGQSDAHAVSHGRSGHGELPLSVSRLCREIAHKKKETKDKNETSHLSLALFRRIQDPAVTHTSVQLLTHKGNKVLKFCREQHLGKKITYF